MYKRILVPLDESKLAECALPHAESMAHAFGSTVLLLSVVSMETFVRHTPADMELFQKTMEANLEGAKRYLRGLAGELAEKNIKAEIHVGFEPVVREIVETAEKQDVDLVLIASHGRSGLKRVFFGGVASGVLNRIEKPLMVIRPSAG